MRVDLFDFDLPPELIAQAPVRPRDAARLLLVDRRPVARDGGARPAGSAAARRPPGAQRHPRAADPLLRPSRRGGGRGHAGRADRRRRLVGAGPARQAAAARRSRSSWRPGSWPRSPARTRRAGCGSASRSPATALLAAIRASGCHAAAALHPPAERGGDPHDRARLPDRVRPPRRCRRGADGLAASDRRAARRGWMPPASSAASSPCMSAPAPSPRSRPRTPPSTACTPNGARFRTPRPRRSRRRAPAAAGSSRSAPPSCAPWRVRADADGAVACRCARDAPVRHPWLPLPGRRPAADQLPPAAQHAVHAGRGLRRPRADPGAPMPTPSRERFRFFSYGDACLLTRRTGAMSFGFELLARDGAARRGRLTTAFGTVETPAFMPVGTAATVKAHDRRHAGRHRRRDRALCNTYHLMLRPGAERIARLGGLHRFMRWDRPDPDRFRRLPGHVAGGAAQARRARRRVQLAPSTAAATSSRPSARSRSSICWMPPSPWCSTSASPCRPTAAEVARAMELSLRWAERSKAAFVRRDRLRPVRHRPGRHRPGAAPRSAAGPGRHRLRRLRHRRPRRRRAAGADVRDARRDLPGAAGRPARAT